MILETLRNYCLGLKASTEDFPFDETTLVFRVGGKIFVFTDVEDFPLHFNLKADPEDVIDLREKYDCIKPGYHCNKKYWITVYPDDSMPESFFLTLVKNSYEIVFNSLKKSEKEKILNQ